MRMTEMMKVLQEIVDYEISSQYTYSGVFVLWSKGGNQDFLTQELAVFSVITSLVIVHKILLFSTTFIVLGLSSTPLIYEKR